MRRSVCGDSFCTGQDRGSLNRDVTSFRPAVTHVLFRTLRNHQHGDEPNRHTLVLIKKSAKNEVTTEGTLGEGQSEKRTPPGSANNLRHAHHDINGRNAWARVGPREIGVGIGQVVVVDAQRQPIVDQVGREILAGDVHGE